MINKLFTVLFSISFISISFASDEIEVNFFNVGQGNCTFIKCPSGPPLLVDAGSSKKPRLPCTNLALRDYVENITQYIKETLPESDQEPAINVMLSHGDKDHYNLVHIILCDISNENRHINFFLGGVEGDYYEDNPTVTYKKKFKALLALHKLKPRRVQFADEAWEQQSPLVCGGNVEATILSSKVHPDNPNGSSIVLKLSYGNHATILTGDAQGVTTDRILKNNSQKLDFLKVSILQVLHHGAETHGSTNEEFVKATNPTYAVFSAGQFRGDYRHPRYSILERLFTHSSNLKKDSVPHFITCSGEGGNFPHELQPNALHYNPADFNIMKTKYGLYSTNDSGDITFNWKFDDVILQEPKQGHYPDQRPQNPTLFGPLSLSSASPPEGKNEKAEKEPIDKDKEKGKEKEEVKREKKTFEKEKKDEKKEKKRNKK